MKTYSALGLALALLAAPVIAQAPAADPAAEAQLLKQQLELLKQRLDALETQNAAAVKAAAEAQAAAAAATAEAKAATEAATEPAPEPAEILDPWLVAENWQKIFRGSDESIIKGLLGRPDSTSMSAAGNTWIYEDPQRPELGRGTVQFMKGRGAVNWEAPKPATR